jgi:DNA-binding CsgD family transcriptional regulator
MSRIVTVDEAVRTRRTISRTCRLISATRWNFKNFKSEKSYPDCIRADLAQVTQDQGEAACKVDWYVTCFSIGCSSPGPTSPNNYLYIYPVYELLRCSSTCGIDMSKRAAQVLQYLALGRSNKEVGRALYICEGTVKNDVKSVLSNLDANCITQAVTVALTRGLIRFGLESFRRRFWC